MDIGKLLGNTLHPLLEAFRWLYSRYGEDLSSSLHKKGWILGFILQDYLSPNESLQDTLLLGQTLGKLHLFSQKTQQLQALRLGNYNALQEFTRAFPLDDLEEALSTFMEASLYGSPFRAYTLQRGISYVIYPYMAGQPRHLLPPYLGQVGYDLEDLLSQIEAELVHETPTSAFRARVQRLIN